MPGTPVPKMSCRHPIHTQMNELDPPLRVETRSDMQELVDGWLGRQSKSRQRLCFHSPQLTTECSNVLLSHNQAGYGTLDVPAISPSRSRSPSRGRSGIPPSRTESLTDIITILSGSIISDGTPADQQLSRSVP